MKTRLTIAACSLLMLSFSPEAQAQAPQLTVANTVPVAGTTLINFITPSFNPGGSGPNQTWDFSSLPYTADNPLDYRDCSAAATTCGKFAAPTLVAFGNSGATAVQYYYKITPTLSTLVGINVATAQISYSLTYTKARDEMRYPMTYGNSFTNAWHSSASIIGGQQLDGGGTDTVEADAWGTIKTPAGSFRALRVKTSILQYDTSKFGTSMNTTITRTVSYRWYDGFNKGPVYTGTISGTGTTTATGIYTKATPAGINTLASNAFGWTVAPNPATGNRIQILLEGKSGAQVTLRLTDLLGRELRTLSATPGSAAGGALTLETAGLPAGTYILSVVADGQPQGAQCVTIAN